MVILSHLVNVSEGLLAHGVSIAAEGTSSSASPTPAVSANTTAGSWAEAFPPKLENAILQAMKQKFISNYPSELIHADLFPSTRLVSLVHDQLTKKTWKWAPWKFRISLTKSEEISGNRAQKMPKIDQEPVENCRDTCGDYISK